MNIVNAIILSLIVIVSIIVFRVIRTRSPIQQEKFTDEDILKLRRMNNLFEDVPLHNGDEWKNLDCEELAGICLDAIGVFCRSHQNEKNFSRPRIILEIEGRCNELSCWMVDNAKRDFYKDSDMNYLIEKSRQVAQILRTEAFKL